MRPYARGRARNTQLGSASADRVPSASPPEARGRQIRPPARRGYRAGAGYVFLVPWFLGITAFVLGPMLISLYLAFTDYDLFTSPQWIGLANFRRMLFDDPRYLSSIGVTISYVVVAVPLKLAIALGIAVLLNRVRRGVGLYRAAFYIPSMLGASVAIALVWRAMFDTGGAVDTALSFFGMGGRSWIYNPSTALATLIALAAWQFGAPMVIFLAGLKQIPREVLDAAAVDGAGARRTFFSVTLPMLSPVVFFNLVLEVIQGFQSFTSAYIVSGGSGGPADSTLVYTLYLYERAFGGHEMGYGSAMAWVLLIAVALITAVLFKTSKRWVFYPGEGGKS